VGIPIVLVHGAMHGAWCWETLIPRLTSAGHSVTALDLPGSDGRLSAAEVTADAYAAAVTEALGQQTQPALLVGHSMGGLPVSLAAERCPEQIAALVYLCAAVPIDDRTLSDTSSDEAVLAEVRSDDDGMTFYFSEAYARRVFFGDCPHYAAAGLSRLRPQALAPLREIVHLSAARFGTVPKHYIRTLKDEVIRPEQQARMAATLSGVELHELDCGHSPFYARPHELAALLHTLAEASAQAPARRI
jgi:pimeloyl-ACP methyl ester carboxylesterase